ncbi:MAG: TIGR02266 family protein [Deltaproteobacteria bacterium]|nr:TIGR02266 family protein [Deltaproteobacteria bacterium]
MRLDTTQFHGGGNPVAHSPRALGDALEKLESSLQDRAAQLDQRLRALSKQKAEIATLVASLGRAGVAVDATWEAVFEDPRVRPDPSCEALTAAAREAHQAAVAACERAAQARAADLERRALTAAELESQAAELAARARELLAQVTAPQVAKTVISAPAAKPSRPPVAADERRTHARTRFEAKVDFESDHNFFTGFSSDISEGGLFIATVNLLPIGSRVDVTFSIGEGPSVSVTGTVRWMREILDDAAVMPGIGVQFDALPENVRSGIHQFIGARDPLFMA